MANATFRADTLLGTDGVDSISGRGGADVIVGADGDDILAGDNGNDKIDGGRGLDLIDGGQGNDSLAGGFGADTIDGSTGADIVVGGEGDDLLFGGTGRDSVLGGSGADTLFGGDENDTLVGGSGNDLIDGGAGTDRARYVGNSSDYTVTRIDDNTIRVFSSDEGTDSLTSVEALDFADGTGLVEDFVSAIRRDTLTNGDDVFDDAVDGRQTGNLVNALGGDDLINGRGGNDILNGDQGDDSLFGGIGRDILSGGFGNDVAFGGSGADSLYGGTGNDFLDGGLGNDLLEGDNGTDILVSDFGNDTLRGGSGNDTALFSRSLSNFDFARNDANVFTLTSDTTTTLVSEIETMEFSDAVLTLDTSVEAGQVYRMFRTALDRDPEPEGATFWIDRLQGATPVETAADSFAEVLTSSLSDPADTTEFVTELFENGLGRAPLPAGLNFWTNAIEQNNGFDRGDAVLAFSESQEAIDRFDFATDFGVWVIEG